MTIRTFLTSACVVLFATTAQAQIIINPANSSGGGGGGAFTSPWLAPTTPVDCSAPQYSFQGDTNTGIGYVAADNFALCIGGVNIAQWHVSGVTMAAGAGTEITFLAGGANIASMDSLSLLAGAGQTLNLGANATNSIVRVASGGLLFPTDNTFPIGASGANRPSIVYAGTSFLSDGTSAAPSHSFPSDPNTGMYWVSEGIIGFSINSSSNMTVQSTGYNVANGLGIRNSTVGTKMVFPGTDGHITLLDNAGTSFGRLQWGGTTSAFPALMRNGTGLEVKLADDSAYTSIRSSALAVNTAVNANAITVIGGAFTGSSDSRAMRIQGTLTAPVGGLGDGLRVDPTIVEAASGTHALFTSLNVAPPTVTVGAATLTDAATLNVTGPPTATVTGGNFSIRVESGNIGLVSGAVQLFELAGDPAAPATNQALFYAKDNGAGKTCIYARFATGAVQQISCEP